MNSFDLDSDGDGCFDIDEVDCLDTDGDGIIGESPVKVDGLGRFVDKYIAHYNFSGDADDRSGNNFHGVVNGAKLVKDRFGIPNSAYFFDGVDDNIVIPHDTLLDLGIYDDIVISMWIYPSDSFNVGPDKSFIKKISTDSSWNYKFKVDGDTSSLDFDINPSNVTDIYSSTTLNSGQWYYLTLMREGDSIIHFLDGEVIYSYRDTTEMGINTEGMIIGGSGEGSDWFNGIIDDIVIAKGCGDYRCSFDMPQDSDSSGVYDFLEAGGPVFYDSISESKTITEMTSTDFEVYSHSVSKVNYEWQVSYDES